ncbi:MAG: hypothetical protein AB1847_23515, partial [bacterium]
WSMATFRGKLYVGTLNGLDGAQIWCSSSGETDTWQKVYQAIPATNLGIRCLYADGDEALYAGTYNSFGAEILKTVDGRRWMTVARGGMGNEGNNSIRCMVRFGNYLYAGTGNSYPPPSTILSSQSSLINPLLMPERVAERMPERMAERVPETRIYGAKLYRSKDGSRWELVRTNPGFETTKVVDLENNTSVTNNILIGELEVFHGQLYAFTWPKDATVQTEITQPQTVGRYSRNLLIDRANRRPKPRIPMLGAQSAPGAFEVWRSDDGVNFEKVVGQDDAYGNGLGLCLHDPSGLDNDAVTSAIVYKDHLYLGTEHDYCKTAIWRTADGTQWEKVLDFFELGELYNLYVWRMITFKDELYAGILNMGSVGVPGGTGAQVWVSPSGDAGSFYHVVHNGFDAETFTSVDLLTYQTTGERIEIEGYKNYGVRTFGILNDTLFAGTATIPSMLVPRSDRQWMPAIAGRDIGCEVWKLAP